MNKYSLIGCSTFLSVLSIQEKDYTFLPLPFSHSRLIFCRLFPCFFFSTVISFFILLCLPTRPVTWSQKNIIVILWNYTSFLLLCASEISWFLCKDCVLGIWVGRILVFLGGVCLVFFNFDWFCWKVQKFDVIVRISLNCRY